MVFLVITKIKIYKKVTELYLCTMNEEFYCIFPVMATSLFKNLFLSIEVLRVIKTNMSKLLYHHRASFTQIMQNLYRRYSIMTRLT